MKALREENERVQTSLFDLANRHEQEVGRKHHEVCNGIVFCVAVCTCTHVCGR